MEMFIWEYNTYRYVLGTLGKSPLIFIGLNPSTATPKNPDHTYCRLNKILENNKHFDSLILLNLYPLVATHTTDLPKKKNAEHYNKNISCIKQVLEECHKENGELNILLGWGSGVTKRKFFQAILEKIKGSLKDYKSSSKFYYVESENKKYPLHPIRYKKNSNPLDSEKQFSEISKFFNIKEA